MKSRRSVVGLLLWIVALGAIVWIFFEVQNLNPNEKPGLLNLIQSIGDGIARRMGRG